MPSIDFKNFARNRADKMAGYVVWFREEPGGEKKLGRVVGYYYDMAQIVIECAWKPTYTVDPQAHHLTMTAGFRQGTWHYTCVAAILVDEEQKQKSSRYPHTCLVCGGNAFILFRTIECSNTACKHYRA